MDDHRTVDGHPVKLGDRVWFWVGWGNVKQRALNKIDLGYWWAHKTSKEIYSTEQAALDAAIEDQRQALKKAKQRAKSAAKSIERLTERRKGLAP